MGTIATIVTIVGGFLGAIIVLTFLRALSTRMMTGKWPHQSEEAKNTFDDLP